MILPSKTIKPIDSLFCISSYVLHEIGIETLTVDEIFIKIEKSYPKKINIETLLLCLNYLFIIGKLEGSDETIKAKF